MALISRPYNFSTYLEARSQSRDPNLEDGDDDDLFVSPMGFQHSCILADSIKANLGGQRWTRMEQDDEMSKAKEFYTDNFIA